MYGDVCSSSLGCREKSDATQRLVFNVADGNVINGGLPLQGKGAQQENTKQVSTQSEI